MLSLHKKVFAFILLCRVLDSLSCLASNLYASNADNEKVSNSLKQSTETTSQKTLYGKVSELSLTQILSEIAQNEFTFELEESNVLPAKITTVSLASIAYKQGLRIGDQITELKAITDKKMIQLKIDRAGKNCSIELPISGPLIGKISDISIALKTPLHHEDAKGDESSSLNTLHGNVSQQGLRSSLYQLAPFGFLATRTGINELPAKVTDVTLHSMAFWQGLKVDDTILDTKADKNLFELSIERDGKSYSIILSNDHPFTATNIAHTALNGVIQKNYGDCAFEANLTAVAISSKGRSLIASMISQISPDLYYVTFLDQPTISWPVNMNTPEYQVQDKALWARILEQANLLRSPPQSFSDKGGSLEPGLGSGMERATRQSMEMLTGKRVGEAIPENTLSFLPGSTCFSQAQMADVINRAILNHEPITIATKGKRSLRLEALCNAFRAVNIPVPLGPNGIPKLPNVDSNIIASIQHSVSYPPLILWGDHVYTIIAFNPSTNILTLRNPFGTDDPSTHWPGTSDIVNFTQRDQLIQEFENGQIRVRLDVIYPYIRKLVWANL